MTDDCSSESRATTVAMRVLSVVFVAIGFSTGYVSSLILKIVGMLRVPEAAEIAGLDTVKVPAQAYPEGIMASPPASQ